MKINKLNIALLLVLLVFLLIDLSMGVKKIGFLDILKAVIGSGTENNVTLLYQFRLPRVLTALLAGSILSLAGLHMQTLFRNPLAGPFILGISSGASLMVSLWLLTGIGAGFGLVALPIVAGIGAFLVLFLVFSIAGKFQNNFTLLILGMLLSYVFSSIETILKQLADASSVKQSLIWGMGSFSNTNMVQVFLLFLVLIFMLIIALKIANNANIYLMGDTFAQSIGLELNKYRFPAIILSGIGAGIVTALCGPIAFVGLVVPHLCRNIIKSSNHNKTTILVVFMGALLTLISDIIASHSMANFNLSINAVLSILGVPLIMYFILKPNAK